MKITDFTIEISRTNVLSLLDCRPESAVYEEVLEEYDEMLAGVYARIHPCASMGFGVIPPEAAGEQAEAGTEALFTIATVGSEISEWSSEFFREGDYLKGMLADAMADDYLFQMDHHLTAEVKRACEGRGMGIYRRVEAPGGISMAIQRTAYDAMDAGRELGIRILDSYMFDPVKCNCQVYLLKEGLKEYRLEHNCRWCGAVSCKLRHVEPVRITVRERSVESVVLCEEKQTLLQAFQTAGISFGACCGGKGSCGKCKIRLLQGQLSITEADRRIFTQEELDSGMRLACRAVPEEDLVIEPAWASEDLVVLADCEGLSNQGALSQCNEYGIGIDIGTTTIAMQLVGFVSRPDADNKETICVDTYTAVNRQRSFGADVISRIQASTAGQGEALRTAICNNITEGLQYFQSMHPDKQVTRICAAGNTTMIHLLMGYSCDTLGVYPFEPVNIAPIQITAGELLGGGRMDGTIKNLADVPWSSAVVTIIPGFSAFVGGDIASGAAVLGMDRTSRTVLLIDLGTNGEMAIGSTKRLLVTSTAAGPAFEGGNISQGTGSIPGAICRVRIRDNLAECDTIADQPAAGLCGTGVLEAVYELVQAGLVDETGLLEDEWFEEGFPLAESPKMRIRITQKDIREIQLAKAAVRAGIEVLMHTYGITARELDRIYLAGGFGYQMDVEKAIGIGMLPREFAGKVEAAGNTSLKGTILALTDPSVTGRLSSLCTAAEEISLAADKEFQDLFMEAMYFEPS